jgi:hypothetical protein
MTFLHEPDPPSQLEDPTDMNMAVPECDDLWIYWFSQLKNVRTVAFICGYELWLEMAIKQTVQMWASKAAPELQRMEFWCRIDHMALTGDFDVGTVWLDDTHKYLDRFTYAIEKDKGDLWNVLDEEETMKSGIKAVVSTSVLDLFLL